MKERLFKKNVLNVKPFFVHVAQVMDVVILHVSFVHVSIYVAMNMFGMYMVHYMLWCQKNLEMSIEYLQRATLIIKKEVGGRELTKLWVYSLVLWEPAFALCPVLWRAVRPWLSPIQDIAALWVIQFCAGAACVFALDS